MLLIVQRPTETERLWTDELLDSPHAALDKAERVRGMFNAIADRYEALFREEWPGTR